jgi:hypothetical protein
MLVRIFTPHCSVARPARTAKGPERVVGDCATWRQRRKETLTRQRPVWRRRNVGSGRVAAARSTIANDNHDIAATRAEPEVAKNIPAPGAEKAPAKEAGTLTDSEGMDREDHVAKHDISARSDREIARQCGASNTFVSNIRTPKVSTVDTLSSTPSPPTKAW